AVPRGQHDHRRPHTFTAQPLEDGEAVHAGQPDVEDHQVEGAAASEHQGGLTVGGVGGGVSRGAQTLLEEGDDAGVVFGDENSAHCDAVLRVSAEQAVPVVPAGSRTGRSMPKVAPCPTVLSTHAEPWCASAMARTMASPSPAPPRSVAGP